MTWGDSTERMCRDDGGSVHIPTPWQLDDRQRAPIIVSLADMQRLTRPRVLVALLTLAALTGCGESGGSVGLIAFGDAGNGSKTQHEVADEMEKWADDHRVDALLEVGDVVYDTGDPKRFDEVVDTPYADLTEERPLWVALGNHDVITNNGDELVAHLDLPGHWYEQVLGDGDVSVQLIVLDSNDVSPTQTEWLVERLAAGSFDWRIVAFHHPPYSCGPHGDTPSTLATWVPILRALDVDLVLSGHDHSYQRFHDSKLTYIVTGGGGADTSDVSVCNSGAIADASAKRHHFLGIEVTENELIVTAVARTGETLDTVTLEAADR